MPGGEQTSPAGLAGRGAQGKSTKRDDDLLASVAPSSTSPTPPASRGASDLGCSAIPTRWRVPVVALLAGLCVLYVSELTTFTRDASSPAAGAVGPDQAEGMASGSYSPSSFYEALGFGDRQGTGRQEEEQEQDEEMQMEPTLPLHDPELLGYAHPAHVPEECRLNKTKVLAAAELALLEGDVSGIEHVDCLYIQDPSFYSWYNADALFERWKVNTNNWKVLNQSLADVMPEVKKVYATYGDRCCEVAVPKALEQAKLAGFDEAIGWNREAMTETVKSKYDHILKQRRGAGYWMWKPYVVLKTLMERMDWGDYLCYVDAGSHFIRDGGDLVAFATQQPYGIWIPHTPGRHTEGRLQKRDNLILMNMNYETIRHSLQGQANHMCLPKTLYAIQIVSEWLKYAVDERCITDMGNTLGEPNWPEFHDHRHDQAIWSLTTKRWGLVPWRDGTFWSEDEMAEEGYLREASGPYMMPFNHHRIKDRRRRLQGEEREEDEQEEVLMEDRMAALMTAIQ